MAVIWVNDSLPQHLGETPTVYEVFEQGQFVGFVSLTPSQVKRYTLAGIYVLRVPKHPYGKEVSRGKM